MVSSNHVSTLKPPEFSFEESKRNSTENAPPLNTTIDGPPLRVSNGEKIIRTRKQKQKDQRDSQRITSILSNPKNEYENNLAKLIEHSNILQKETFYGIKHLLEKEHVDTTKRPVLFIIPNIKAFPAGVLNDLIHHLKIYRGYPHFLNLNLMLGVQNNNKEEVHLRVSI